MQTLSLPYGNFKFLSEEEKKKIDWMTIDMSKDIGYFIECDLEYPLEIRKKTASFPLCPENITIDYEMLSPYQKKVLFDVYGKKTYKSTKLTATFLNKEKIVLHGSNLQLYLKLGMKLLKVHRVISFSQKPFMKEWVDFCTGMRSKAKNDFEKNLFKNMCNMVFGRSIMSLTNRKSVKITVNKEQFSKCVRDPNYERHIIINENVCVCILSKPTAYLKTPYYIGFSILELSKNIMYDYFYYVLRPEFGDNRISVIYSDTDSLIMRMTSRNIYDKLRALRHTFDFSNLNPKHPFYDVSKRAHLFKFKEEFSLYPIARICALKSKVYAIQTCCDCNIGINQFGFCIYCRNVWDKWTHKDALYETDFGDETIKIKGIDKRSAREIYFDNYLQCLFHNIPQRHFVRHIRSEKHQLSTSILNKLSLTAFDDKRYILNCGVHSLPYSKNVYSQSPYCYECQI